MTYSKTRYKISNALLNLTGLSVITFFSMGVIFFFNTELLPINIMIMLLAWNFIAMFVLAILTAVVTPTELYGLYDPVTPTQSHTSQTVIKQQIRRVCNACNGTGRCNYCRGTGHIGAANVYIKNASKSCTPCSSTGVCRVCKGTGQPSSSTYDS